MACYIEDITPTLELETDNGDLTAPVTFSVYEPSHDDDYPTCNLESIRLGGYQMPHAVAVEWLGRAYVSRLEESVATGWTRYQSEDAA